MCLLCSHLGGGSHWSEQAGGEAAPRLRHRRARLLASVLAPQGLVVHDDLQGAAFTVATRTGAAAVVGDLGELWAAAERLTGRRLDPLDPDLVASLVDDAAAPGPTTPTART